MLVSHFINTIILMTMAFLMTFSFGIMAAGFGVILLIFKDELIRSKVI